MNKVLMILMVSLSIASAQAEDKIITVKGGKTKEYDPKEWVVVHKRKKKPVVAKPAPVAPTETTKVVEVTKEVRVFQKNHLRLLGGVGPTGTSIERLGNLVTMSSNYSVVFGLMYGRNITERWSLEGALTTNGTTLLGVGYNW